MTRSFLTVATLVFVRLWRHSIRQPAFAFILPAMMPLGLVVFISQLYGEMARQPGYGGATMLAWMGPGLIFLAATMGSGFTAAVLASDAAHGFADRLRLLAVPGGAIITGSLLFEGFRILPVAGVLLGASALLGLTLPGPGILLAVLGLAALWATAWNSVFLVAAVRTRSTQLALILMPLFLPFFLSSTIMVPRSLLPGYVQAVVDWNPLDRFVRAARPWFHESAADLADIGIAVLAAAAIIAMSATATRRLLATATS